VQQHFLWLLLTSYALAAFWPAPGLAMRNWKWSPHAYSNLPVSIPLVLLAVMLFSAALLTDLSHVRVVSHHPLVLCSALLAVWLGPAILVIIAGWIVPLVFDGAATSGLLVAFALVAAMPVANSSVGWTQNARGNLALSLALVVLSISLSPWVTPNLLSVLGMSLSPRERLYIEALVTEFSGTFFIMWVILPTAAGFAVRYLMTPARIENSRSWIVLSSAAALLVLNYINSALALPKVFDSPTSLLLATAVLAASLSVIGLILGWSISRVLHFKPETRAALMFGLSMKHTGLALILAAAVLKDEPLAILLIALATLLQHLLAGVTQWLMNVKDAGDRMQGAG
jgi:BASS family bile acid:Na+ symporter